MKRSLLRLDSLLLYEDPPGISAEAGIQGNSLDSRLRGNDDRVTRGNDDRVTRGGDDRVTPTGIHVLLCLRTQKQIIT